jgi:uncharacterized protein YjbI with pentapeptide repeats
MFEVMGAAADVAARDLADRFRVVRRDSGRGVYIVVRLGGSFGVLAMVGIVVCAILVAAGSTFITGTEVLEAAVYTVVFSGLIAVAFVVLGRSRTESAQPASTAEERLAVARAAALLAAEEPRQRLEGALQLEALVQVRPDLAGAAAQAFRGLIPSSGMNSGSSSSSFSSSPSSSFSRYAVLAAVQALSRLNALLREQGQTLDLRRADLAGLDLSGLDLRGANLSGANLAKAILTGTDLTGATLTGANLDHADLSEADLGYAYLQGASLAGAIQAGVHLEATYLPRAVDGSL